MSLHGSRRFIRSLLASLLLLGLVAVAVWTVQPRPSTAHAASGSLVQVTNFGSNPTNLQMWLYVPPSVKPHPAILLALHYCGGTGPAFFSGTEFANLADQFGFIVIYPSVSLPPARSLQCWDVSTPAGLTRNGGGDSQGLISMLSYVEQHNNGDASNVFVTGASSGAMMTNVMLAEYPEIFKAGAAFMGVPYHCFATTDGSMWNSACANGQVSMTAQQWGNLARSADPGYTGPRPRMQLWHGTADSTLFFPNFGEEIKQWTNVLGVSQTPSLTDSPQSGWTRTRYGGTGTNAPVEGISIQGVGHSLPMAGQAAMAIQFMGLNTPSNSTPTPTASSGTNLLTNANAEAGTTGWAVFGSGTLSSNTSVFHGGTHSLLLTGRTAAWNGISQNVTSRLTNGKSYTTSVWVRTQSGAPSAKVTLALTLNGTTSFVALTPSAAVNTSGWTLLSGTATVSWSGSLSNAVWYVETVSGTDNLLADDASFR
jgi:poly(hydroxyalkanoate) depolymerase family esterase